MGSMTFSRRRKTVGQSGWREREGEKLRDENKGARNCVRVRDVSRSTLTMTTRDSRAKTEKSIPRYRLDKNGVNIFAGPCCAKPTIQTTLLSLSRGLSIKRTPEMGANLRGISAVSILEGWMKLDNYLPYISWSI